VQTEQRAVVTPEPTNSPPRKSAAAPKGDPVFVAYDRPLIEAVQNRWFKLLDEQHFDGSPKGQVTLRFRLHPDGRVSDDVVESTIDAALTQLVQKALTDSAPFPPWPDEMRQKVKGDYREVTFKFFYR